MNNDRYECPVCYGHNLVLKYEADYVYSYVLDSDAPGLLNEDEFLSWLYDRRELEYDRTYIECIKCGTQYPYSFITGVLDKENSIVSV